MQDELPNETLPDNHPTRQQWIERYAKPLLLFIGFLYMRQSNELNDERAARRLLDRQNDTLYERVGRAEAKNVITDREDSVRQASNGLVPVADSGDAMDPKSEI